MHFERYTKEELAAKHRRRRRRTHRRALLRVAVAVGAAVALILGVLAVGKGGGVRSTMQMPAMEP
jgi:hypothetical protein